MSTSEGWSAWPAPAKLNLFLRILGRRADGYHELQTVFQLLDWGDTVWLRARRDGRLELVAGAPGVPPEQDLALRAARALADRSGCRHGADIRIEKRIPAGGGLGGGSSDAASVLVGLDQLWGTGLGQDGLAGLGLDLGADVPVFVRGHSAWAEGRGERLLPMALPERWFLLALPNAQVSTAELFQAPDLTRNAPPATMQGFISDEVTDNAFTPLVRRRVPAVSEALDRLGKFGMARMSGTGSACFVAFDDRDAAEAAQRRLSGVLRLQLARGVSRSPLLQAVERHGLDAWP